MFRGPRGARPSSRHPAIAGASRPSAALRAFAPRNTERRRKAPALQALPGATFAIQILKEKFSGTPDETQKNYRAAKFWGAILGARGSSWKKRIADSDSPTPIY